MNSACATLTQNPTPRASRGSSRISCTLSSTSRARTSLPVYTWSKSSTRYPPRCQRRPSRSTQSETPKYWKGHSNRRLMASGKRISALASPPNQWNTSSSSLRSGVAVRPKQHLRADVVQQPPVAGGRRMMELVHDDIAEAIRRQSP